jgi:hypothetical protein
VTAAVSFVFVFEPQNLFIIEIKFFCQIFDRLITSGYENPGAKLLLTFRADCPEACP